MNRISSWIRQVASAGNRARVCLLVLLVTVFVGGAHAAGVTVSVNETQGTYSVRGELVTHAPLAVAWSVLTDYDHISSFVRSMKTSVSEQRPDGRLVVRQVAVAGLFPVRKTVHIELEVSEEAGRSIAFHDVLLRDFHTYAGAWDVTADSSGTRVYYWLEASPKMFVPFAGRSVMTRSARDLLSQVGAEIARRAAAGPSRSPTMSPVTDARLIH